MLHLVYTSIIEELSKAAPITSGKATRESRLFTLGNLYIKEENLLASTRGVVGLTVGLLSLI